MSYNGITVKHIVATDRNGCIGKAGQMPWHVPADLKRFKDLTTGGVVIMGRKTFGSLNYEPLPNRLNLVISRQRIHSYPVMVFNDTDCALSYAASKAQELGLDTIWIIGGAEIYKQTMQYTDVIEHTLIDTEVVDGDAFYPDREPDMRPVFFSGMISSNNSFDYSYSTYLRFINNGKT